MNYDYIEQGDCLELMKQIPDGSIDLVVTDPPYGMNFQSHRRKEVYEKIHNDDTLVWLDDYFAECERILKNNSAIYCFCSWHNIDLFKKCFEKYFKIKNVCVLVKNNHGSGDLKAGYAPKHEFVLYGNKGRRLFEGKRMADVFFADKTKNEYHPTEKPTDLLETFIQNSSCEGDVILDGFMGSGSTCVAAVNTNRHYIGFELDPTYFQIACDRLDEAEEKFLQQKSLDRGQEGDKS